MPKKYILTPRLWLARDEASVKRHIESDDYFGTIATVLGLIKQQIRSHPTTGTALLTKTLKNLEEDLMFLQNNYQIIYRSSLSQEPQDQKKE